MFFFFNDETCHSILDCTCDISAITINTTSGFWQDNHDFFPPPRRNWIRGSLNCQSAGLQGWSCWILNLSFSLFSGEIVCSLTSRSPTYIYILFFMSLLTREVDDTCFHTSNILLVVGPRMHEQFIWTVLAHRWCWCIQLTPTRYLCVVIYYAFLEVWMQYYYALCYSGIDTVHITHNAFYLISSLLLLA